MLNERKTQSMIIGNRSKLSKLVDPIPFVINGKSVIFVKKYNYLGFLLDCEMSLLPLYKNIEKRLVDKIYMLKKLRKYITYNAALQIHKQTILPILDYAGFLLLLCNKNKKHDLQVIQNDILRFCENKRLQDCVSIEKLHKKSNLLSLEQRRMKQVLVIMYKLSKDIKNRKVTNRVTRTSNKFIFHTDTKIGTKYASSPFYKGTLIWDKLPEETQLAENIFQFKKDINRLYKTFDRNTTV